MNPTLPRWADVLLLPLLNLGVALLAAGIVVALVGYDPWQVLAALVHGAFGTARGFSYTLYYATTFVFTGLAVAVAYHAGLFNIGGEGQAMMGGLGAALVGLNSVLGIVSPAKFQHGRLAIRTHGRCGKWHPRALGGIAAVKPDWHHTVSVSSNHSDACKRSRQGCGKHQIVGIIQLRQAHG